MAHDIWREKTPLHERDMRSFKRAAYGMQKYRHRDNAKVMHKRNADQHKAGVAALESHRKAMHSTARLPQKSKRQIQHTATAGRLQLPEFVTKEWPRGFDSRLSEDWGGKPAHETVPTSWFKDNEAELVQLVKKHISNPFGTASPAQKMRARMALQGWMAEKLERRRCDLKKQWHMHEAVRSSNEGGGGGGGGGSGGGGGGGL
jgi:hypothetical protein